jgi:hypothetical protein
MTTGAPLRLQKNTKILDREPAFTDLPTVSMRDAATILNMGINQFRKRFRVCLKDRIRSVDTKNGRRLLLMDVIDFGYQNISDEAKVRLAADFVMKFAENRLKKWGTEDV